MGKEEAAKVAAAEAESPKKPLGFFDKLMKLVSAIYLCEPSAGFIITAINIGGGGGHSTYAARRESRRRSRKRS